MEPTASNEPNFCRFPAVSITATNRGRDPLFVPLTEVRHDKAEEAAKSFRISSGNGRVCTTFAAEFEAFGEDKTELLQEHLLLSRRFGNAAQADLAAIGSRQNDIGALQTGQQR